jgi:RNA polymerase sigma-70 factor, ECF subfamily
VRTVVGDARRERFEAIAPALMDPLRRYLARRTDPTTADDVLAETLLVCWRRIDELPDDPLPWSYGVARRCLANAERGVRRQQRLAAKVAAVDPPAATAPAPEPGDHPDLEVALASLRDEDAELLRLWAWEQLAPAEIATVLDVTPNAVSIRLHRAREKLRAELVARKRTGTSGHEESTERRQG